MWAKYATPPPPPSSGVASWPTAGRNCRNIQIPSSTIAGISRMNMKKKKNSVSTRANGYSSA